MATDVVLRAGGVARDLGPVEDQEQLLLARVEAGQQTVEGDEPGPAAEDPIEAGAQLGCSLAARVALVRLETLGSSPRAVEPPDQLAGQRDGQPAGGG